MNIERDCRRIITDSPIILIVCGESLLRIERQVFVDRKDSRGNVEARANAFCQKICRFARHQNRSQQNPSILRSRLDQTAIFFADLLKVCDVGNVC